ncbi:hypothetical protein [uncultured Mycobacterium sp.]
MSRRLLATSTAADIDLIPVLRDTGLTMLVWSAAVSLSLALAR